MPSRVCCMRLAVIICCSDTKFLSVNFPTTLKQRTHSKRCQWHMTCSVNPRRGAYTILGNRPPHTTTFPPSPQATLKTLSEALSSACSTTSWMVTSKWYGRYYVGLSCLDFDAIIYRLPGSMNDINPTLRLGEDNIGSILAALQSIRERALSESKWFAYIWVPLLSLN